MERKDINRNEEKYLSLLKEVLHYGYEKDDRTDTGTKSLHCKKRVYDLQKGFPLVTTKKVYWKGIVSELVWFLKGKTNVNWLEDRGVHIWSEDEWTDDEGDVGPLYGKQWRCWETKGGETIDQLQDVLDRIDDKPYSRRHIMTTLNVGELDEMSLYPCHGIAIQFLKRGDKLDLGMYQRSGDMFLGVVFNIASYALLLKMVAQLKGYKPGKLHHVIGDAHIYKNHGNQVKKQLQRKPKEPPKVELDDVDSIDDYEIENIHLEDYNHYDKISAPVAK